MTFPARATRAAAMVLLIAALSASCGGTSGGDKTRTAVARPSSVASAASGTPAISTTAIRAVDLKGVADVQSLSREAGGEFSPQSVLYADLTGDSVEEAVIPIASGGTQGDAAFIVLTPDGSGGATTVLSVTPQGAGGMSVDVKDGKVVETEPKAGPDDPECCPAMLRLTTYAWNGSRLAVESILDVPNPAGGGKATAPSGVPPKPNTSQ